MYFVMSGGKIVLYLIILMCPRRSLNCCARNSSKTCPVIFEIGTVLVLLGSFWVGISSLQVEVLKQLLQEEGKKVNLISSLL